MTVNAISKLVHGESTRTIRISALVIVTGILTLIALLFLSSPAAPNEEGAGIGENIHLELPEPTGPYPVGTTEMHLLDETRADPWVGKQPRELMISIWYPARQAGGQEAMYMRPGAAQHYDENTISTIGVDSGRIDLSKIGTHAWLDAPVADSEEGWPIIIYSPGGSVPRNFGTILVEELASRGYAVVTVDHTHETSAVEFRTDGW